jgi:hypothetical protein
MLRSLQRQLAGGKKLTFLYVPDNASVRQFVVPKSFFYALAGAVVMGFGLLAFFGSKYLGAAADGRQNLALRGENLQLNERLAMLQAQLAGLQGAMAENQEAERQLRVVANLPEVDPDVLAAGTGGPMPPLPSAAALAPETRRNVENLERDLGTLLRQARMQRESYDQILVALRDTRQVWDHTPSVRPLAQGSITSHYGRRMDPFTGQAAMHRGVDFVARPGAPIRATAAGTVINTGWSGSFGLVVEIDHGSGLVTRYAHCKAVLVRPGERVERGAVVARVGSTGKSSGTHVHYEVLKNGMQVDPMAYVLPTDVVVD